MITLQDRLTNAYHIIGNSDMSREDREYVQRAILEARDALSNAIIP